MLLFIFNLISPSHECLPVKVQRAALQAPPPPLRIMSAVHDKEGNEIVLRGKAQNLGVYSRQKRRSGWAPRYHVCG